ncbi:hypothetical protein HMPREF9080_01439 [Cardiobacterium valvarum F0432]|uniref:Uncharacterized protein n=1 Tax=Cardiobacterium valvarum F0432 TaxID=797473 RepID=G9ZF94_9GAMM|nr:hypothetical protein HMPREF9080_01439 [Cardiobacterium valvarum F0432]
MVILSGAWYERAGILSLPLLQGYGLFGWRGCGVSAGCQAGQPLGLL